MRLAAALLCVAGPVWADDIALLGYMGGQGCTFGVQSMAGAVAAGFDAVDMDRFITEALERGDASQQGLWVVLDESICTIRLPDVQSPLPIDDPDIQAATPYIKDEIEFDGETSVTEGCFLTEGFDLFTVLNDGDVDAGMSDYMKFLGAGIISGELRFYAPTPLSTPNGFQVTVGDCANAPNIDAVTASHPFVISGFGDYVRFAGANTVCGEDITDEAPLFVARMQGYDTDADETVWQPEINALLGFEFDIIARATGWYEGMSGSERGTPRPPLCHFPDQ